MSWDGPGWKRAARDYHATRAGRRSVVEIEPDRLASLRRLLDPAVSLEEAQRIANAARPTPETTIEAIMYCVRTRGLKALKEPANIERLSRCDAAALAQIDARLKKYRTDAC